jgi:hypothetical protein
MVVRYGLFVVGLCVALGPAFAQDCEYVSFDPLPDNAEELARAHLVEFLAQRYPDETIVVGEAIPLYVIENDIKALDFIMELDGEEPCTFEREYAIFSDWKEKYDTYQAYNDTLKGNHEAWERVHNHEDEEYNRLFDELHDATFKRNSISHIVIVFVEGSPRIIGTHNPYIMCSAFFKLTEEENGRFIGFGTVSGSDIRVILSNDSLRDGMEWLLRGDYHDYEYYRNRFEAIYLCHYQIPAYPFPMNASFFSAGFASRGREDIAPINTYDLYLETHGSESVTETDE